MNCTIPESELNIFLASRHVREADLATIRERLEDKVEEWFYECAVPEGIYSEEDGDEPTLSYFSVTAMLQWHEERRLASLDEAHRRLRTIQNFKLLKAQLNSRGLTAMWIDNYLNKHYPKGY